MKKKRNPYDDIYLGNSFNRKRVKKQQRRKDAFVWKVGIFAITIISIMGVYTIWWAINQ